MSGAATGWVSVPGVAAASIGASRSGLRAREAGTVPAESAPLIMVFTWVEAAPGIGIVAQLGSLGPRVGGFVGVLVAASPAVDLAWWGWWR